ncbi:hypothetical protein [Algisphaera agarilytica]|uniref:Uncharacterized protein n=1 Tax=Algisphaera agarilytica TaxID=1385975 RepID=A0A7X0LK96_9BACT|nr:hypothetical protein [Algisphaera agarilytica]MBB6429406.1 hypothetical protein [Algisphaera agarilytica]
MCTFRPNALAWITLSVAALQVGCSARVGGDGRSLSQHNDELRRDNQELRQQIDETQKQLALLESELRVYREDAAGSGAIPGAVAPVFSGLEFGRYSGPIDSNGDGTDDEVRLYIKPTDQRGRTLVVPGQVKVQLLDVTGDSPEVLLEKLWEPADWDAAYRSGFTGDHYSLTLALAEELLADRDTLNVVVQLTEATRGTSREIQAVYPLHR